MSLRAHLIELGRVASAHYWRELNDVISNENLTKSQGDFEKINEYLPDKFTNLLPLLATCLQSAPANSVVLLPNITLYEAYDKLIAKTPFLSKKVLHPVHATQRYLQKKRITSITLVGSLYSMRANYLRQQFSQYQINVCVPTDIDQVFFDECRREIYTQNFTTKKIIQLQKLLKKYSQNQSVVLACTEFSAIFPYIESLYSDSIIDMATCHINLLTSQHLSIHHEKIS